MQKKSDRDWRNVIFIDEWTFYLEPPRKKKYKKGNNNFEERRNFKQKINRWGFESNGKCILIFFKENMSNTIYENILEDYMPELKRIGNNYVLILMDNHPVHKNLNSLKCYKEKV